MGVRRSSPFFQNLDFITFWIYLALIGIGLLMIHAVNLDEFEHISFLSFFSTTVGKQTLWVGISTIAFITIFIIEWKFWETFAYPIYLFTLLLLVAVLIFGTTIKGATSWFTIGGISLQPSEFAKFGTALAVSSFLSAYSTSLKQNQSILTALLVISIPAGLILLQGDAGSALVFLSFFIVFYREGLSANYYIVGIVTTVLLLLGLVFPPLNVITLLLWTSIGIIAYSLLPNYYWILGTVALGIVGYFLSKEVAFQYLFYGFLVIGIAFGIYAWLKLKKGPLVRLLLFAVIAGSAISSVANYAFNNILQVHQQERINAWLKPSASSPRAMYNVVQSKMAISSGGITGKGFKKGTMTQLNYVPEQSTDFIFCTIGEEQGFIGSFGIVGLFLILLLRLTIIAERQRSNFSRIYIYTVAGILFIHILINIGMTMGLMPIIGIPLPFISKGGSALLGFTIMMAVLLKLDANRYNI